MKKIILIVVFIIIVAAVSFHWEKKSKPPQEHFKSSQKKSQILYYTCGMHPSVNVSPQSYNKGNNSCPICHMDLVPVYKDGAGASDDAANVISISPKALALAGIETSKVRVLPLFKEIRTVGVIAYDPGLRTAQEEYIQALRTYKKVSQSQFEDAKRRAKDILDASKTKLRLLGESEELIKELEASAKPDDSLILPADFMWVYADVYEHEMFWPQVGDSVEIISLADTSITFEGKIKAKDPVLNEKTRTLRLKIKVANKGRILKPNMYVDVYLKSELGSVLSLPKEAILDTGKRKIIYVEQGEGKFMLKEVTVGPLAQGIIKGAKKYFYPLIEGAQEGDYVVSKGNFLIDSQAQLGAASSIYGGALGEKETAPAHQH